MLPAGYVVCHVVERSDVTDDLALFKLRTEEPLPFVPGQYLTLALPCGENLVRRAYSIASAPHEPLIELFIERVEDGELTPRLWDLAAGDTLLARKKIVGHFTLDPTHGLHRHILAATVTGIAPFVSMVRAQAHALATGQQTAPEHFLVLHGASHANELQPHRAELADLAARADWLTYVPTISRPWQNPGWAGEVGRVEDIVRKYTDAHGFTAQTAVAYACGNPQMIEHVHGILGRAGFPKDRLREEKYFSLKNEPAPAAAPVEAAAPPRSAPKAPPGFAPRTVKPAS